MRVESEDVFDQYDRPAATVTGDTLERKRVLAAAFTVFCADE